MCTPLQPCVSGGPVYSEQMKQRGRTRTGPVLALLFCALAAAQSPGTFNPTGNLTLPRSFHTATLLHNGKVLLAGGASFGNIVPTSSAELYDPSTGTFTATGDMATPRSIHTATLLPSGKVLIAGGIMRADSGLLLPQATAELYDPATGTFSATGSMTVPRDRHSAILLNNGKVLIVGGSKPIPQQGWPPYHSAELYDPSTGTFNAAGDMTEPGAETATLLPDGKVLVTRCVDYCFTASKPNGADLYDPSTGTFSRTGNMVNGLQGAWPMAVLLLNGKVLIAGGNLGDFGGSTSAELYDAASGVFTITGKLTANIYQGTAALLPDGTVFISGGSDVFPPDPHPGVYSATEVYDPAAGAFAAPVASRPLWGQTLTLLPDGTLLQSGGSPPNESTGAEIYHAARLVPSYVLLSLSGDGHGQGAVLHAGTTRLVSANDPAVVGEALEIYGTGLIDGSVIPPQVAVGNVLAEVLYFGKAPGFAGLNQVNIRVPGGITPGAAIGVRVNYLSRPSNEVTIAVK